MKNELARGMRKKILLLLLTSFILSKIAVLFLLGVVLVFQSLAHVSLLSFLVFPVNGIVSFLYYSVGVMPTLYMTDLFLFVCFVLLLSSKKVSYLAGIIEAVKKMSNGKFDVSLPVPTKRNTPKNELAMLASDINQMGERLEEAIKEELKAVQGKNELITNVSHDLRTPLTSIIGYLRLIEEDRYKDEVDLRYYINIAYDKSKRLERMVNDLFEYTRVSYGTLALHRTEINVIQLLAQLAAQFSLQAEELNMEIKLFFSQENIKIMADGDKLVRVFENLISNALKYGSEGKWVEIRADLEQDEAVIEVVNYGKRIPASDIPQLFNRFYRVDKSRSDHTGGSGLGLAIAKSIVDLHQGTIEVTSSEFETNFEVRLPALVKLAPPKLSSKEEAIAKQLVPRTVKNK